MPDTNELEDQAPEPDATPAPAFLADSTRVEWIGEGEARRPETLEEVAARVGAGADELFELNRGVIGSDPSSVTAGMVIEYWRPA